MTNIVDKNKYVLYNREKYEERWERKMFCKNCGAELTADTKFCPKCGKGVTSNNANKMYCSNCGKEVHDEYCSNCGTKITENGNCNNVHNINLNIGRQHNPYKTNTYAIWSLILACTSFVFGWFLLAIVAIILGNMAKTQIMERNEQGCNLASAGIVLGWINIGLSIFAVVLLLIFSAGFLAWLV